ncbi:MAG: sigma-70 family RNA polymerase sigma factor [Defluviitaleaceae bacterium]|nr:sigma-70 family RNA polymerase sigma factor [Defluviitaleaceae bacterium]
MYQNEFNDEYLARQVALGDREAEDALLRRFLGRVKIIARPYFIMGGDREDLIQEGMVGLYKAIREYRADFTASFATFATVCIKNQILDAIKSASRKKHSPLNGYVSMDVSNPEIEGITDIGQEPDQILIDRETKVRLEKIMQARLSKLENTVLTHFLEGDSYAQIADKMDITTKSVDNALLRIRKKVLQFDDKG